MNYKTREEFENKAKFMFDDDEISLDFIDDGGVYRYEKTRNLFAMFCFGADFGRSDDEYEAVREAAKERYAPKWISVEDELPHIGTYGVDETYVLAKCVHTGTFAVASLCHPCEGHEDETNWFIDVSESAVQESYFTHWMPLPEAPEADND